MGEAFVPGTDYTKRERANRPVVSILLPCFNEAEALSRFREIGVPHLEAAIGDVDLEFVLIDDGSGDETRTVATDWVREDARVRVYGFSRNFGKEAALTKGLREARGDIVVPMDVDLQDPPETVGEMLDLWRSGVDHVLAVRRERASDNILKQFTANTFYRAFNVFSSSKIPENAGDFRLLDRRVVEALLQLPERSRFMKGLFAWVGFDTAVVYYDRPERSAGVTKFNFLKLWNFALDGITGYSGAPLKAWTYIGLAMGLCAIVYAAYVFTKTLLIGDPVQGYSSLMIVILIAAAFNMISIGILGEYVNRIFIEVKNRPMYIVDYHAARSDDTRSDA